MPTPSRATRLHHMCKVRPRPSQAPTPPPTPPWRPRALRIMPRATSLNAPQATRAHHMRGGDPSLHLGADALAPANALCRLPLRRRSKPSRARPCPGPCGERRLVRGGKARHRQDEPHQRNANGVASKPRNIGDMAWRLLPASHSSADTPCRRSHAQRARAAATMRKWATAGRCGTQGGSRRPQDAIAVEAKAMTP